MELHTIIKKLVGPIQPIGESNEDSRRYANLKTTLDLVDCLLQDIVRVALQAGTHEASISKAGKRAEKYLGTLPDLIEL